MCWNKEVSLLTFALGSYLSCNLYQTTAFKAESIVWFWVILMQLFETMIWSDPNCGPINYLGTKGAMIATILQPVVILLSALYFNKYPTPVIGYAVAITIGYSLIMLKHYKELKQIDCVKPSCKHLKYTWWDVADAKYYSLAIFILIFLLWKNPYSNLAYLGIMSVISSNVFKDKHGSVLCWLAAFGPIWTKYVKF